MAVKTTAQLTTALTNLVLSNGANSVTGEALETFLQDLIDSVVNNQSDQTDMVTATTRVGAETCSTGQNVISFSSDLPSVNYRVFFFDADSIVDMAADIQNQGVSSFEITTTGSGVVRWLAIMDN